MSDETSLSMTSDHRHPDFVLAAIPMTLFAAYGVGTVFQTWLVTVMAAVGICYGLMMDRLFWHSPTE
ncbi:hypothetical protein DJ68_09795 [Halorubrum sp. C3]|nr:hypothetical protein DJ68_09795 [Halorubrum sp. C3]